MGSCFSTQEFSRKNSKKEHAFIKLRLICDFCSIENPCYWPRIFGDRWMSVDEEYMRANPQIFPTVSQKQGIVIGLLELHGSFCLWNDEGTKTLVKYLELADLVQVWDRPSDKTCVGELRGLMEKLAEANVEVKLSPPGI
ncbi:uncharacterized protein B0T23DRAFT_456610 [Neurospora hispaniola]|uniref:Uncharacterized protein n=1 Tax=Neurospora hispaniola TaxID=588809 RepID=A0AAJ0MMZ3_9PEZI|nr:hypothetical protein B0T23DRAFT_456610 [Neurospora hispaniola]